MNLLRLPATYLLACLGATVVMPATAQVVANSSGSSMTIAIYDPYSMAYDNVSGSPYVPEKGFAEGLFVAKGVQQKQLIRYNMQEGRIEYLDGAKVMRLITPINEFQLVIEAGDTLLFRKGFSGRNDLNPAQYCQVLFDGKKTQLIRSMTVTIKSNEDPMSNDFGKRRIVQKDSYYLLAGAEPVALSPSKNALLAAFPAVQKETVSAIINAQPGKLKSWADVRNVLSAYESR